MLTSGSSGTLIDAEIDGDDIPTISTKMYTIATNLAVYQYIADALTAMGYPVPTPTLHNSEYKVLKQYLLSNGFPTNPYQQSRILAVTAIPKTVASAPVTLELHGAAPNPFVGQTMVRFSLSEPQHVLLKVYNTTGREVATLANNHLRSGNHQRSFSANGLPAGMYFCILRASGVQKMTKLLITR